MTVTERFLQYVSFATASDEASPSCPSTEGQRALGAHLAAELPALGLSEVEQDADG